MIGSDLVVAASLIRLATLAPGRQKELDAPGLLHVWIPLWLVLVATTPLVLASDPASLRPGLLSFVTVLSIFIGVLAGSGYAFWLLREAGRWALIQVGRYEQWSTFHERIVRQLNGEGIHDRMAVRMKRRGKPTPVDLELLTPVAPLVAGDWKARRSREETDQSRIEDR